MRLGPCSWGEKAASSLLGAPRGHRDARFSPEATRSFGQSTAPSILTAPLRGRLSVPPILQMSKVGHLTQLGGKACALWRFSLPLFLLVPPLHLLTTQERAVVGITSAPTLLAEAGCVAKPKGSRAGGPPPG